jgi:hypothetical protein
MILELQKVPPRFAVNIEKSTKTAEKNVVIFNVGHDFLSHALYHGSKFFSGYGLNGYQKTQCIFQQYTLTFVTKCI